MHALVRPAVPEDAESIAEVQVRTWQIAYRSQLPDSFLDGLDHTRGQRAEFWRTEIATPRSAQHAICVAQFGTEVEGFAAFGPARDADPTAGEIYAIYVLPHRWNQGLGRALLSESTKRLAAGRFETALLWVLESNQRARRFYEIAGWAHDGGKKLERLPDGTELREVRYQLVFPRNEE